MTTNSLSAFNYSDMLKDEFSNEYEERIRYFHSELVELNVIIYLSEKILDFPLDLFILPPESIFFPMVLYSFYDSAILLISRIANDENKDVYSILHFKNDILKGMKDEYKPQFRKLLKEVSFNKEIKRILEHTSEFRNNAIAHKTKDYIFNGLKLHKPNLDQMKCLRDNLNNLVNILSFDVERAMLPIPYYARSKMQNRVDKKTDIEKILDSIAKNSVLINMPEDNPETWKYYRMGLTSDLVSIINKFREKFSLHTI